MCPNGTYFSPNNNNCSVCPANSVSERDGLAQCDCIDGYYRAATGEEDLPCRCKLLVHADRLFNNTDRRTKSLSLYILQCLHHDL